MPKKEYYIYDARYWWDEDRAVIFEVCHSLKEAQKSRTDYGDDCVIVSSDDEVMPNE